MSPKANKYILLVFTLIMMSSCGGKKKLVQKSEFSTEVATVEKVSEKTEKATVKESLTVQVAEKNNVLIQENFQGEVSDSSKQATLTVENLGNKKVYTYTNFKNVTSGSQSSNTKSKDSTAVREWVAELAKTISESETETDLKASGSSKDIDIEKDGKFPWWILIVLAVLTILYIWYSRVKSTYMPWKWFSK